MVKAVSQGGFKKSIESKRVKQKRGGNEHVVRAEYSYAWGLTKPQRRP